MGWLAEAVPGVPQEIPQVIALVRPFRLVRDEHGYAQAIAVDEWFLIHLHRGTVRNEENAEKLLAVLNAAVAVVNNLSWAGVCDEDIALERSLQDIMCYEEKEEGRCPAS